MRRLTATADGSCLGNPGPGGWAWVVDETCWAAGSHARTTNNLMELRAVYELLVAAPLDLPLRIQTDSSYVINVFTQWLQGWIQSGWRTSAKRDVANRQSIEMIAALLDRRDVEWVHVKGHSGHPENELADQHARDAAICEQQGRPIAEGNPSCIAQAAKTQA